MKSRIWLMLGIMVMVSPAYAGNLTLSEAIQLAMARAPGFQAEEARRDAAREDVLLARAWLLPYVKASGSYQHLEQSYNFAHPLAIPLRTRLNYNQTTMVLQLIQPLFHLDRWAAWKQGQVADEAAVMALKLARQSLVLEVAARYSEALVARIELAALTHKRHALQRAAAMMQARMAAGLATRPQQLEAQSRARLVEAEWLAASQHQDIAAARLDSLIGRQHALLPEQLPDVQLPESDRDWQSLARTKALAVQLAQLQYVIADREVQRAMGNALPSVDLVAGLTRDKTTDGLFGAGVTRKDEMIGIQIEVPVYAGGGTWAQLRKSKKQRIESSFRVQDTEREAALAAEEAALQFSASRARVQALQVAVEAAVSARDAARTSFETGLSTIVTVLDAESRLADARRALAQARQGALMARLQLEASIGRLDVDTLPVKH